MGHLTFCPDCKIGKLYASKTEEGYSQLTCYACGYYWYDSPGYDELSRQLFKEYFPTEEGWKPSPAVGRPFTSPDHWTERARRRTRV